MRIKTAFVSLALALGCSERVMEGMDEVGTSETWSVPESIPMCCWCVDGKSICLNSQGPDHDAWCADYGFSVNGEETVLIECVMDENGYPEDCSLECAL